MYLKSLTLKGFKSFADPTTLELRPGVTVVVGPNGSGKSNVVDAVAWVLGAQGPRVVRSAKMDDVIFAGTEKRPALGRAEVSLTIDNASRRLPLDFTEVTVTRTLFRTGESEYALNGVPCRLLDVQELLSDTGVGRQQHVIVGQGQLDAVLAARPEDRRAIVEEAAGVLKYRRRRERAERRLEASEASLARLQDLHRELRRQLKPLERQAASALRHEQLAAELRALRLHLAGRELQALGSRLAQGEREGGALEQAAARLGAELAGLDQELAAAQSGLASRPEELEAPLGTCQRLAERAEGLASLAEERRRARTELLAAQLDGEELAGLEQERQRVAADLERGELEASRLLPEWERLGESEQELAAREAVDAERFGAAELPAEGSVAPGLRAQQAELKEALARAREAEVRAVERAQALERRREDAEGRLARAREAVARVAPELSEAERAEQAAAAEHRGSEQEAARTAEERREAEQARHRAAARVEALGLALEEARARAGMARLAGLPGVLGTLLDVVEVDEAVVPAFEAAVEGVLEAVLVEGAAAARAALTQLRARGEQGSVLPLPPAHQASPPPAPSLVGAEPLASLVRTGRPEVRTLLDRLLQGVLLSRAPFEAALEQALAAPERTIVTLAGDRFAPSGWRLGAGRAGATRAALEAAEGEAEAASRRAGEAAAAEEEARRARDLARERAASVLRRLDQLGAELARAEQVAAEAEGELAALAPEAARVQEEGEAAGSAAREEAGRLAALEARLAAAQTAEEELAARARDALAARRAREERARALAALRHDLEVRAAALEERRTLLLARAGELEQRLAGRAAERERAEQRREHHQHDDQVLARLAGVLRSCRERSLELADRLRAERDRRARAAHERLEELARVRRQRDERERALAANRERRQRLEIEQTEARVRHEAAVEALARDLEAVPEEALAAPWPELPAGTEPVARAREVERELRVLGPVNPLAREELEALQERSGFVESQLEDVRAARRELGQVIQAVDGEIVEVFSAAYADLERHFQQLFTTLFPGGTGRLSLTTPEDPLSTGIEIEARPAGRNVRRLSLLSGGERSLVALAFLFAVFRSRPSPFYLLDEVEAALDEVNLRRFLDLLEEFRAEAQLIVVSHQKRTMEVADALYGVTMQPGGASKVVSERLRRDAAEVGS